MPTASYWQNRIIAEVGDSDTNVLAATITDDWDTYAPKASIHPDLQYLYAKRTAIDRVLGALAAQVGFSTPMLTVRVNERPDRLLALRAEVQTEVDRIEVRARSNRSGVLSQMTTTAPESPPTTFTTGPANANDPRYRGDAYRPLSPWNSRSVR